MGNHKDPCGAGFLPDVCTPAILAAHTGLPEQTFLSWIEAGELPAREVAGRWLITRRAFLDALEARRAGAYLPREAE